MDDARTQPNAYANELRLELAVAKIIADRRSCTVQFADADGERHALVFRGGTRVTLRSPLPAEEIFRRSASATNIIVEERDEKAPAEASALDAFDLLYRGVRAVGPSGSFASTIEQDGRPFV